MTYLKSSIIKPIIFNSEMVRAILEGRKTMTRRVIKPQFKETPECWNMPIGFWATGITNIRIDDTVKCPYGQVGDKLWVRETFIIESTYGFEESYRKLPNDRPHRTEKYDDNGSDDVFHLIPHYRATEPEPNIVCEDLEDAYDDRTRWEPSIHMPRWASRITLEITNIRVERLQEIRDNEEDAIREGFKPQIPNTKYFHRSARVEFISYWNSLITKIDYSWQRDPWVWVIEFKQI